MLGLTGVIKVVAPNTMAKEFTFVPKFAWRLVGYYEIYVGYQIYKMGMYSSMLPLVYAFFGGVVYCLFRQGAKGLPILPFPLLNVAANCAMGLNNGTDTTSAIVPYLGAGFVFAAVLCMLPGGGVAKQAKKKGQ